MPRIPGSALRCISFSQADQPASARHFLEEAVRQTPSDPEPYLILGNIALQERRFADAAMDFDKAKQLLADYKGNAERKGAIEQQKLSGMALLAESQQEWTDAEKLPPGSVLSWRPRIWRSTSAWPKSLFRQDKAKEAYDILKKAKQIDRDNAAKNQSKESVLTPEAIMAKLHDEYDGPRIDGTGIMVQGGAGACAGRSAHPPSRCDMGPGKRQDRLCQGADRGRLADRGGG